MSNNPKYSNLLLTCAIACDVVYDEKPLAYLNQTYETYNHQITNVTSSITSDLDKDALLETRYIVCDCSTEHSKRLVVAFRGSYNKPDVLTDIKVLPADNSLGHGLLHGGFLSRAQCIPLDVFSEMIFQGYEIVFTGHSMGGAVAAILAYKLLSDAKVKLLDDPLVKFIGFGVPLLGSESFRDKINQRGWLQRFHFYVNSADVVPRAISILSQVIQKMSDSKLIDNACKYIQLVSSALGYGKNNVKFQALQEVGIPVFQFLLTTLTKLLSKVTNTFVPFGNHILIDYDREDNQLVKEYHDGSIYGTRQNFSPNHLFSEKQLKALQDHRMKNYLTEVIEMCKKLDCPFMNAHHMWGLYTERKFATVNTDFQLSLEEEGLNKIQRFKLRLIKNETSMDVRLTITTNPKEFSNYITNVMVTSPPCTYTCRKDEGEGEVTFCLNGVLSDFMDEEALFKKEIKVKIFTHFNSIKVTIPITDSPEMGQTIKQEKISKLSTDLLYMYALSFIFATKKITNRMIIDQREELERCIVDLDNLGKGEVLNTNLKSSDDIYNHMLCMFSEGTYDGDFKSQLEELTEGNQFIFSGTMQPLIGSDSFSDIIQNKFPAILHHSNRLSFPIKETFTESIGMGLGGTGVGVSAGVAAGLMFVPGVNVLAFWYLLGAASVSAIALGGFVASFISKNRSVYFYEKNLKTIISSIEGLDYRSTIPTAYHFEKLIFDWSRSEKGIFKNNSDNYIISNWGSFFKSNSTVALIQTRHRPAVLKIIRNICINYQLREALMKNLYVGVVGMKKCGKSTFVEKLLHTSTNASSFIATREIKAYPLSENIPFFAFWDYPHYESQDVTHKIQYFTSRFLMDYVIVLYNSETEADTTTLGSHIKLIKQSAHVGFTVLMNKADTLWCEELTRKILDEKKELSRKNLGLTHEKYALEYCSIHSKEEHVTKLQKCGILLMPEIRKKIWDELTKSKLIPEKYLPLIEEKWMELGRKDSKKVKIIFYKRGKKLKREFKWEEISDLTFEELSEDLKEQFDFESIYIGARVGGDIISSMISLFDHPEHEFDVYQ